MIDMTRRHAPWCRPHTYRPDDRTCMVKGCDIERRWATATCQCRARGWTPDHCVYASDGVRDHPPMVWMHEAHLVCLKCGADGT